MIQIIKMKEAIHCKTQKLANQVLKIAHEKGLKWYSGDSFLDDDRWQTYKENI